MNALVDWLVNGGVQVVIGLAGALWCAIGLFGVAWSETRYRCERGN